MITYPQILAKLKDQVIPSGQGDQHPEGSTCPFPGHSVKPLQVFG